MNIMYSHLCIRFPYYIGVVDELRRQKIITERTKIAGSSAVRYVLFFVEL